MKEHKYLNNPIIVIILAIALMFILPIPAEGISNITGNSMLAGIVNVIVGLIAIILYSLYFKDELKKCFLGANNIIKGLILLIPLFVILIVSCLIVPPELTNIQYGLVIFAVGGALIEEVIFRGILVSSFMRFWRDENKIPIIVLISGLIFGLIHLLNIFAGAPLEITIIQVVDSACMGCFLAAIFLKTGNIWIPIIAHGLNNLLATLYPQNFKGNGIMAVTNITTIEYLLALLPVILLIFAFYYVRKSKRAEIKELWDETWI